MMHGSDSSITIVDKMTYAAIRASLVGVDQRRTALVIGDITNADLLNHLVSKNDAVVRFAADSHNDNSLSDSGIFICTNIVGSHELLEAVRWHGLRLHRDSTDEVFVDLGLGRPAAFTETIPRSGLSCP